MEIGKEINPNITVYCSERCYPCHALCEWLDSMGVKYNKRVYKRGTVDPDWPLEITSFPTFELNGNFVRGFDRNKIMKLLNTYHNR